MRGEKIRMNLLDSPDSLLVFIIRGDGGGGGSNELCRGLL